VAESKGRDSYRFDNPNATIENQIGKIENHYHSPASSDKATPFPYYYPRDLGSTTFVGRGNELDELHRLLQTSQRVGIVAATGMGGIGKTELAWQYANRHRVDYPGGIWWMSAATLVGDVLTYGTRMKLPEAPDTLESDVSRVQWYYDRWVEAIPNGARLLVWDDVSEYGAVKSFLPQDERYRILLTTRKQLEENQQEDQRLRRLRLGTLPPLESYQLLYQGLHWNEREDWIDPRLLREQAQAENLCQFVGDLPLAIEVVGSFLRVEKDWSISQLLERLKCERLENEALNPVQVAFQVSWDLLSQAERQLAGLLGVFAAAPVEWEWVTSAIQACRIETPKPNLWQRLCKKRSDIEQWCLLLNSQELESARRRLLGLSLLNRVEEGVYQLHPLIRGFFAQKLETEMALEAQGLQRGVAEVLVAEAKTVYPTVTLSELERVQGAVPHWQVVAEGLTALLEGIDAPWPFIALGRVARGQSRWQEAERWYRDCLGICERELGRNHASTAASLNNLAALYSSMGRYEDAMLLVERSLGIRERELGRNHASTAASLNNLAELYRSMGRYEDAMPLYERALGICERELGCDHPTTATSLNNLAGLYRSMGRYEDAMPLYERSLGIRERELGRDHASTATSLNNLAELYRSMGRYEDAMPLYERSLGKIDPLL